MNPTILNFSRAWGIVQLLFFTLFAALAIWILSDIFAPNDVAPQSSMIGGTLRPELDRTPEILFDTIPRQPHQSAIDRLTGGWFTAAVMIIGLCYFGGAIVLRLWRMTTSKPALLFQNKRLTPHSSFWGAPDSIAITRINAISLDRSDRMSNGEQQSAIRAISSSGYLGAKLGQRLRHTLKIDFTDDYRAPKTFKISDSDVDGGLEHMQRFANILQLAWASEKRIDAGNALHLG